MTQKPRDDYKTSLFDKHPKPNPRVKAILLISVFNAGLTLGFILATTIN